jgi:hypothetical protein
MQHPLVSCETQFLELPNLKLGCEPRDDIHAQTANLAWHFFESNLM